MATTKQNALNKAAPGVGKNAKLGDVLNDLITAHNALLAKLDSNHAAATDHVATLTVTPLASR